MERALTLCIPNLVRDGIFGEAEFDSIEPKKGKSLAMQFGSTVSSVKLNVRNKVSKETHNFPIFIKVQMSDPASRISRDCANMFHNEVTMYKDILPFLNPENPTNYGKFYYGYADGKNDLDNDILIIEDLTKSGYTLCQEKVFLDYNHIVIAMKAIGRLHSWSFCAKRNEESNFLELANKLRLVEPIDDHEFGFPKMVANCAKRGIEKVMVGSEEKEKLKKFLAPFYALKKLQRLLWETSDPFRVVIHGDFCKNNIFYKYDSCGKPVEVTFFDFQLSKLSSPAIDLSFFLYLHTTAEMRQKHWVEFLDIYWNAVKANVPAGFSLPSLGEFLDHFSSKAVYGYIPVSFYLPMILFLDTNTSSSLYEMGKEEKYYFLSSLGGEEGTSVISDVVSHMLEKGYIDSFLKTVDNLDWV